MTSRVHQLAREIARAFWHEKAATAPAPRRIVPQPARPAPPPRAPRDDGSADALVRAVLGQPARRGR